MSNGTRWRITAVVTLGLFMAVLDNSIVSVALPQMENAFHTDYDTITWVATAYFLSQAAVIPVVGYLSDRIGTKLVFMVSLILFTLGSALCALSPTKELLIAARVFQGIGGGALLPITFAIIYRIFSPTERGQVSAVIGIPVIMAPAFGPTIGGFLSTTFDWSAIFTINIPIGIIALILGFLVLPGRTTEFASQERTLEKGVQGGFDFAGLILSMVGFTILTYGITEASSHGWGSSLVLASVIIGVVVLAIFVLVELRASDPVIDVRLFKNYTFAISNILMGIVTAVLFGGLFLLPLFFENVQGNSALTAGEILISQGLATGVGMALAGVLYNRLGPRILVISGFIATIVGTYGLTKLNVGTTGLSLQGWLIIRGLGLGTLNTPLQTLALSVVSNRAMAKASSLVSVARQVAGAIGVAILTTYLTQQTTNYGTNIGNSIKAGVVNHQLSGVAATCVQAGGPTLNQTLVRNCVTQHALTNSLSNTFLVILIFCAICMVVALFLGRDPAIEAYKQAKARGEDVKLENQMVMSE